MPIKKLNLLTTVAIFTLPLAIVAHALTSEVDTGEPSPFVSLNDTADDWLVLSESLVQKDVVETLARFDELLVQYPRNTVILEQDFMYSLTEGHLERAIERGQTYIEAMQQKEVSEENKKYIQERSSIVDILKVLQYLKQDSANAETAILLDKTIASSNDISLITSLIIKAHLAPQEKERNQILQQLDKSFPKLLSHYIRLQYAYFDGDDQKSRAILQENPELYALLEVNDIHALVELFSQSESVEKAKEIQLLWVKNAKDRKFFKIKEADNLVQASLEQKIAQTLMILGRIYSSAFSDNPNFRNQLAFHMAQYLDSNSSVVDYNLARSHLALNHFEKAQKILEPLLDKPSVSARARFDYGLTLEREEKFEQALALYKQLESEFPFDISVLESQAEIYRRTSDFKAAIPLLDKAIELAKQQYPISGNINEKGEESEKFASVSDIPPQALYLVFARGICYERLNNWEKAEADLVWAMQNAPEDPIILNYLAYSWVDRGYNLDEAEAMLKLAIEKFPNDGNIIDSLGWVYFRKNNLDEAIKWLDIAANLEPAQGEILSHLGDALWWNGRKREALYAWQRVIDVDPNSENIKKIRHKLKTQRPIQIPGHPRIDFMPIEVRAENSEKE